MKDLAIYIHIPFCYSKCYYCDFCSYPNRYDIRDKYIDYLKREIDIYARKISSHHNVKTIFIGGGTPSYIEGRYIHELLNHIYKKFDVSNLEEVTIESNPKTLDEEKLKIYKESGINRISLGLQTMNDSLLKEIGRIHTSKDFLETFELVRKQGFDNVNADIMFNLPNQKVKDVEDSLIKIIDLGIEHISFYSLKVEEGTPFHKRNEKGNLNLPSEDTEREMYHHGINILEENGYKHYEISNFAKKGFQCQHNLFYWKLKPYIGLGMAAHSNINSERYGNVIDFKEYFTSIDNGNLPIDLENKEIIDREMEMAEYMILGLRLLDGINKLQFYNRFGVTLENAIGSSVLSKLEKQGLLIVGNQNIKLTRRGADLSNQVFMELLP
ncbi:MAG: oxygen-independent coproporphyrinogen III oxidase [Firmicutes bacterium]|nr:oxygen-independent coproporphyrinogen III oxidase [Bacillota bacterium]